MPQKASVNILDSDWLILGLCCLSQNSLPIIRVARAKTRMADATTEAAEPTAADAATENTAPEETDWGAHLTSMLSFSMGSSEATAPDPPAAPEEDDEAAVSAALEAAAAAEAAEPAPDAISEATAVELEADAPTTNDDASAVETDAAVDGEDGGWSASLSSMLPTFAMGDEGATDMPAGDFNEAEHLALDEALANAEV